MTIKEIQKSCIHLVLINRLVNPQIFHPKNSIFLKTLDSGFLDIGVWFTDQNSKSLEIEDKTKIILLINFSVKYEE